MPLKPLQPFTVVTEDVLLEPEKKGVKPPKCILCPWSCTGYSFAHDWVGNDVHAAFMFSTPSKNDVIAGSILGSDWTKSIFRQYIAPLNLTRDNVIITSVLRCYPPWDVRTGGPGYPTGETKKKAEKLCRLYDEGLRKFDPNVFIMTFDPKDALNVLSYVPQIEADLKKVRQFIDDGLRPLVLFGNAPAEMLFPHIVGKGSVKAWRGHFAEREFPKIL